MRCAFVVRHVATADDYADCQVGVFLLAVFGASVACLRRAWVQQVALAPTVGAGRVAGLLGFVHKARLAPRAGFARHRSAHPTC